MNKPSVPFNKYSAHTPISKSKTEWMEEREKDVCVLHLNELDSQTEAERLFKASVTVFHERTPPVWAQVESNTVKDLANTQRTLKSTKWWRITVGNPARPNNGDQSPSFEVVNRFRAVETTSQRVKLTMSNLLLWVQTTLGKASVVKHLDELSIYESEAFIPSAQCWSPRMVLSQSTGAELDTWSMSALVVYQLVDITQPYRLTGAHHYYCYY